MYDTIHKVNRIVYDMIIAKDADSEPPNAICPNKYLLWATESAGIGCNGLGSVDSAILQARFSGAP
jgi:hypothetical protein